MDGAAGDLEAIARQIHELLRSAPTSSPSHRALHAKGTIASGTFQASGDLAGLTTAEHLVAGETPATVRFSHPAGDPNAVDSIPSSRGVAVKLAADAGSHDLVAVSSPAFPVRNGRAFLELLVARAPDRATAAPDPAAIGVFLEAHPESVPAVTAAITARVPASYASLVYNSLHTFFLVDDAGDRRPFRYAWAPPEGEAFLDADQAHGLDLHAELTQRLAVGPVPLDLVVRLGEPEDSTDDPTAIWPERPALVAGRLKIEAVATDAEPIIFDPTNVPAGVALPEGDEILALRRHVYGLSYAARSG